MKLKIPFSSSQSLLSIKPRWQGILFFLAALLILFLPLPLQAGTPVDRVIRVEASTYQFTPEEISVNPGDRVTIELAATDVVHGFSLDGYDFSITAEPGKTVSKTFVADKSGTFRFRCSVPCGNLHPFIIGKLQVGSNTLFMRALGLGFLAILAAFWSLRISFGNRRGASNIVNQSGLN